MATCKIPLHNKEGTVVAEALISECDRENVEKHRWYRKKARKTFYAAAKIGGRQTTLHSFLMGRRKGMCVDHINHEGLDNRRPNIRMASIRQNNQNCRDRKGSNTYTGVSWNRICSKWVARCCRKHAGCFDTEREAARAYDWAALALCGAGAKVNGLLTAEETEYVLAHPDDLSPVKRDRGLPLGVYIKKGEKTYLAKLIYKKQPVIIGRYQTVEAASAAVIAKKKVLRDAELAAHNAIPIERNEDGIAVIPVRNAAGDIVEHALVSDDDWHWLTLCSWNMVDGYPIGRLDGIARKMHQHLIPGQECIDHINHVRHDNTRENLRSSDYSHNSQNRPKKEGCASKYVGVEAYGKYWVATIRKDNKKEFLGSYMTEEEAARAYNVRAMELYDRPQLNMVADVVEPALEPAVLEGLGNRKMNGSSSRYMGVHKSHKKWAVALMVEGKQVRVGRYAEETDAARAYNKALDQYGLDKRRNNVPT